MFQNNFRMVWQHSCGHTRLPCFIKFISFPTCVISSPHPPHMASYPLTASEHSMPLHCIYLSSTTNMHMRKLSLKRKIITSYDSSKNKKWKRKMEKHREDAESNREHLKKEKMKRKIQDIKENMKRK